MTKTKRAIQWCNCGGCPDCRETDRIIAEWDKEPPRRLTHAEKIDQMDEWDFENGIRRSFNDI